MAQLEPDALRAVEQALARYIGEVEGAGLRSSTAHTYIHHARAFVRWLKGGFAPGATLPRAWPRGGASRGGPRRMGASRERPINPRRRDQGAGSGGPRRRAGPPGRLRRGERWSAPRGR